MHDILFFTGPGCTYCKAVKPRVQQLATALGIEYIEVNIEEEPSQALINEYRVTSIPVAVVRGPTPDVARGMPDILALTRRLLPAAQG